jgi:hypothetical protein
MFLVENCAGTNFRSVSGEEKRKRIVRVGENDGGSGKRSDGKKCSSVERSPGVIEWFFGGRFKVFERRGKSGIVRNEVAAEIDKSEKGGKGSRSFWLRPVKDGV